jgi:hypothetical protein
MTSASRHEQVGCMRGWLWTVETMLGSLHAFCKGVNVIGQAGLNVQRKDKAHHHW